MFESETTLHAGVTNDEIGSGRVCRQLVEDPQRYAFWRSWHSVRMLNVAERLRREAQILALRAVLLEQIHRTALVCYLRQNAITGSDRDLTLQEFYGIIDTRRAAVAEHRSYLVSASSQLCAHRLLELVGDDRGLGLLQDYQGTFGQFFGMFCANSRAVRQNSSYFLQGLIPDAKVEAEALRARILAGAGLPPVPVAIKRGVLPRAQQRARG